MDFELGAPVSVDYKKKYEEALNRAKHALDCHKQGMVSTDVPLITSMFPELKESEDERIRQEIIDSIKRSMVGMSDSSKATYNSWIAWIEKQKPTELSEEEKTTIEEIIFAVMQMPSGRDDTKRKCLKWLDKQKSKL